MPRNCPQKHVSHIGAGKHLRRPAASNHLPHHCALPCPALPTLLSLVWHTITSNEAHPSAPSASIKISSEYENNILRFRQTECMGGGERYLGGCGGGEALVWAASLAYLCAHSGARCGRSQHPKPTEPPSLRLSLALSASCAGLLHSNFFSFFFFFFFFSQ